MDIERFGLIGVLLGGAVPWLEAVVVIPAGILLGLPPLAVVVAAVVGNLSTVALAAFAGERLRVYFSALQRRGRVEVDAMEAGEGEGAGDAEGGGAGGDPAREGRSARAARVMDRYGLPGLAILGPLGIGTQLSAALAVSLGVSGRRAFVWVGAATVGWSVVVALLVVWGVGAAGA
jgi:hypothetical protein